MTLKELLLACSFKEIAPIISELNPSQTDMLPHYKEAFDLLCHMKVDERIYSHENNGIHVELDKLNESGKNDNLFVNKQIIVNDRINMPKNRLAAQCLYNLMLYGFNKKDREQYSKFEVEPTKNEWIQDIIHQMTENTLLVEQKKLKYLYNAKSICHTTYHSHTYNAEKRMAYITELLRKYAHIDFSKYSRIMLIFKTSSTYPLMAYELQKRQELFNLTSKKVEIRWGFGTDESLGEEMSLLLVGSD